MKSMGKLKVNKKKVAGFSRGKRQIEYENENKIEN